MYRLPSEKEEHKATIGALILSIIIIIAGIGGMIYTKKVSWEYKNSTDVRTIDALVYNCAQTNEKDDNGNRKEEYQVRFTYEIDGTTYDDLKTYSEKKREGDTVRIGTRANSVLLSCICCNDSARSHWFCRTN